MGANSETAYSFVPEKARHSRRTLFRAGDGSSAGRRKRRRKASSAGFVTEIPRGQSHLWRERVRNWAVHFLLCVKLIHHSGGDKARRSQEIAAILIVGAVLDMACVGLGKLLFPHRARAARD